jgi:hypothetical protein
MRAKNDLSGCQRRHAGTTGMLATLFLVTLGVPAMAQLPPPPGYRNCMELAVVGALVARENLPEKAGCNLPVLLDSAGLKTMELPAPAQVDSKVSMLKKGHNWVISASGGVLIHAFSVLEKAQKGVISDAVREGAVPGTGSNWWWN